MGARAILWKVPRILRCKIDMMSYRMGVSSSYQSGLALR